MLARLIGTLRPFTQTVSVSGVAETNSPVTAPASSLIRIDAFAASAITSVHPPPTGACMSNADNNRRAVI
jgi:hypothetical protein